VRCPRSILSAEELLAHAIEIEREAAARYLELGQHLRNLGHVSVAELFLRLAATERKHQRELESRAQGLRLPSIAPGEYAWLDRAGPETAAHGLVLNLLTAHDALQIALAAEQRALAFFEAAQAQAADPALARLARELAAEEGVHVAWVKSALRRTPSPNIDWEAILG